MTQVVVRLIDLHVMRREKGQPYYLMMQRSAGEIYEHIWQGVTGKIKSGETAWQAAIRELREETGYRESEMIPLSDVHPNPAFLNNRCFTFLAKDVFPAGEQEQDDREDIEVLVKPLEEIPRLIRDGSITHSLVLAAFYRYFMEYLPAQSL